MNLINGFILSLIISIIAYKKKSLKLNGAIMATFLGSTIYYNGGSLLFLAMIMFFISSSIISKIGKRNDIKKINEKGSNRDYKQVLANGIVALIFSILYKIKQQDIYLVIAFISFAVSTADTWGSEIGTLFNGKVVSITSFKPLEKGLSGGISLAGTISSALGALMIALIFYIGLDLNNKSSYYTLSIFIFGFLGSIIDSILGSVFQGKYLEKNTNKIIEKRYSSKNEENQLIKGIYFINNDVVNILSNIITTILAIISIV